MRAAVFERDGGRCRYCRLNQTGQAATFHVNHVVPRSRGGATELDNLVLQCPYCSLHKADKTTALDRLTQATVPLFHPLLQDWNSHLRLDEHGIVEGLTVTGRATTEALRMNDPLPRTARSLQVMLGLM
jgi:hypothetical protein